MVIGSLLFSISIYSPDEFIQYQDFKYHVYTSQICMSSSDQTLSHSPLVPLPYPSQSLIYLSQMNFPILYISYKCNYTACGLCLLSLSTMLSRFIFVVSVLYSFFRLNYMPLFRLTVCSSLINGNSVFLVANLIVSIVKLHPRFNHIYPHLVVKLLIFLYFCKYFFSSSYICPWLLNVFLLQNLE